MLMRRFYKDPDNRNVTKKAFNVGFHPTFLYIFPNAWIYSLPFNFIVDSIVLLIGFKIFGKEKVWHNWKKSILLSWIFGYLADVAAAFLLLAFEFMAGAMFHTSVMANPFRGPGQFLCTLLAVLVAGVLIYVFNAKIALRKTELDAKAKKKVALLMAIVTMPFPFFMPLTF